MDTPRGPRGFSKLRFLHFEKLTFQSGISESCSGLGVVACWGRGNKRTQLSARVDLENLYQNVTKFTQKFVGKFQSSLFKN